jgi:hypothetical protein
MPVPINYQGRVIWKYLHHHKIGGKGTWRAKRGEMIAPVRYREFGTYGPLIYSKTHAQVHFDGNRTWSRVPVSQLKIE